MHLLSVVDAIKIEEAEDEGPTFFLKLDPPGCLRRPVAGRLTVGLSEACRRYIGRRVLISPFYGYGWSRLDADAPRLGYEEMAGPPPFHARLAEFFDHDGELRGATAIVEEPGHRYDGCHTVFSTRHVGEFDFTTRVGHYNIEIGPSIRVGAWPHVAGSPALMGFAEIRDEVAA